MHLPWLQSDLHPHALSLTEEALDRPDFAQALECDLATLNPPDIIHRYRVVTRADQGSAALVAAGFVATRLTQIHRLALDVLSAGALPPRLAAHWFTPGERAPWADWVNAHWRHYCRTHHSNPPRIPADGLSRVFIGQDLLYGLALRDGPQGRVRAFASLREEQELGWIDGPAPLLPWLLDACLRRAAAIGWTSASLEVDDDHRPLWALIQDLDLPEPQTFVTWQKERRPAHRPN